ncbi:TPA: hypothetical protein EYP83_02970 [Candidatus Geothermarchaeota archaeon]|nr:hypothetical protein [Candidatus Geothermarchaeota archaeon]HIQ13307.1 hypothetical protein [Thermoprotei archaeon]
MAPLASIDSGATKTDILVIEGDSIYFNRFYKPLNIHTLSIKDIKISLKEINELLNQYNVEEVVWGLAGLDTDKDYNLWINLLKPYKTIRHRILHDVEMALYAAEPSGKGVLVVSGTGSNVYGYDGDKKIKCGDWGAYYGDDFSGYRVGRELLNLILHIFDGRINYEDIFNDFIKYIGIDREELPNWIYNLDIKDVASLSKYACINIEVEPIKNILDRILKEMEMAITTVLAKIDIDSPIHYTGGLFKCRYIYDGFIEICRGNHWRIGKYIEYPVLGGISYILYNRGYEEDDIIRYCEEIYKEIINIQGKSK